MVNGDVVVEEGDSDFDFGIGILSPRFAFQVSFSNLMANAG